MKILAISLAFPPLAYPRSIQVARLLKHSQASAVLFCAEEPGARLDATIESDARLDACVRVPVNKSLAAGLVDKISFRLARTIWNRRNFAPDAYGMWRKDVTAAVSEYVAKSGYRPDAIVTFAQPFSDHLIGLELKSRLGLPWLAHFSDPWADNPFVEVDSTTRNLNVKLERSVAEAADVLVFTSSETVDLFFRKYPEKLRQKARVLPQCFDADLYSDSQVCDDKVRIRYLGNFYGHRTPKPLIDAVSEIHRRDPNALDDVVFELIGPGDATEVARLAAKLPSGLIDARPSVNYRESLDLMSRADGLLIIDAPAEISVFLPSKLIDYIGSGRPVFGVTPDGAAASLIRQLGGETADPADIALVADALRKFVADIRNRRTIETSNPWGTPAVRERYAAGTVAAAFDGILDELGPASGETYDLT